MVHCRIGGSYISWRRFRQISGGKHSAQGCRSAAFPGIKHGSSSSSSVTGGTWLLHTHKPVTRIIIQMCWSVGLFADKEAECGSLFSEQEPPFPRRCPSLPPPGHTLVCHWSTAVQSRVAFAEGHEKEPMNGRIARDGRGSTKM